MSLMSLCSGFSQAFSVSVGGTFLMRRKRKTNTRVKKKKERKENGAEGGGGEGRGKEEEELGIDMCWALLSVSPIYIEEKRGRKRKWRTELGETFGRKHLLFSSSQTGMAILIIPSIHPSISKAGRLISSHICLVSSLLSWGGRRQDGRH